MNHRSSSRAEWQILSFFEWARASLGEIGPGASKPDTLIGFSFHLIPLQDLTF